MQILIIFSGRYSSTYSFLFSSIEERNTNNMLHASRFSCLMSIFYMILLKVTFSYLTLIFSIRLWPLLLLLLFLFWFILRGAVEKKVDSNESSRLIISLTFNDFYKIYFLPAVVRILARGVAVGGGYFCLLVFFLLLLLLRFFLLLGGLGWLGPRKFRYC